MQTLELLVSLKIPDVTALTAASSIRRRLGYNEVLNELRRSDYYSLDLNTTDRYLLVFHVRHHVVCK